MIRLIGFCILFLYIAGCSDDPVSDNSPKVFSGTVARAEHTETNDFAEFYDITWEYNSETDKLTFEGRLKSINEAVRLQGISLYLTGDGIPLGGGSGFLSFLYEKDGAWNTATVMRWWITVDTDNKPDTIEIFSDLRIWLDADGNQRQTQETEKLGWFDLQ